jgi:serine/threonine protein kinase/tetratricopeptide (TPR) repeat protein
MEQPDERVKAVFLQALDFEPGPELAAFLDRACAQEPDLRPKVEALLRAHADAGQFLERFAPEPGATVGSPSGPLIEGLGGPAPLDDEGPGTHLGPYQLLQKIGEGGMGAVWMAEQQQPVRRKVALKVIKAGLDSAQVVARFEAERQALALMDHPNIAKVFDAGTTEQGRPFFVMELVRGMPITKYCDELQLPIRERLALFVPVCQALQHAHQKGVIHRDIKPSNVLVAPYDGKPVIKVIDFGIAKAAGQPLTDKTLFTEFGAVVGTLEYMSPEQAELNNQDIDTRSDVYSLGVLLYELLTGTTPLTRQQMQRAGFLELLRVIREEEPPRPSTRLSSSQEALPAISAQRRMEPAQLTKLMRGELDWIVMKALDKDRGRRYESANSLAHDINRYLHDEPVEACPPSARYRLGKFVRRHKGPVVTAALVLSALVLGMAGTTWGLVRAERAVQAEAERAEGERLAKIEAQQAREAEATRAEGERRAKEQQAALRRKAEKAEQQARDSEADTQAFSRFLVDDVLSVARPEGEMGGLGIDVTVKRALVEASGKIAERFRGRPRAEALARHDLGVTFRLVGDLARAVEQLEQALALRRRALGPDHDDTLDTMNSLAVAYRTAGKFDHALSLGEELLKRTRAKMGPGHRDTLHSMGNLAVAYQEAGQRDKALVLVREAFNVQKTTLGPEHPDTVTSMHHLAVVYQKAGKSDLALPLMQKALALRKARLGEGHSETLATLGNLAGLYWSLKKLDRSIPLFEEVLALRKKKQGAEHPETIRGAFNLGVNYSDAGRHDEAVAVFDEWLARARATLKPGQPPRDFGVRAGAIVYSKAGRLDKAEPLWHEWAALQKQKAGAVSAPHAIALAELGVNLLRQHKWAEAEPVLREGLAIREKVDPDAWTTFYARSRLGAALLGQQKYAEAEPLLLAGYEGLKQREAKIPTDSTFTLTETLERLVRLYDAWGKKDKAEEWRKKWEDTKAAVKPPAGP